MKARFPWKTTAVFVVGVLVGVFVNIPFDEVLRALRPNPIKRDGILAIISDPRPAVFTLNAFCRVNREVEKWICEAYPKLQQERVEMLIAPSSASGFETVCWNDNGGVVLPELQRKEVLDWIVKKLTAYSDIDVDAKNGEPQRGVEPSSAGAPEGRTR